MRISIVGGGLHAALCGNYIGGAEKQSALIAASLAQLGHEVTAIDLSHGLVPVEKKGVRVVGAWDANKGVRILRFFTHRVPTLIKTLRAARPDIVYIRSTDLSFATVALIGLPPGSKFAWGTAHDQDVDMTLSAIRTRHASIYGRIVDGTLLNLSARTLMRKADLVFCQTEGQQEIVRSRGRNATIIPNLFDLGDVPRETPTRLLKPCCLWIGKFCGTKGEKQLLELARKVPTCEFRAIGHSTPEFGRTELFGCIRRQENIRLLGRMAYPAVLEELLRVPLLVHTAPAEGFSNTFLEAWACGCPVVSLSVDPNGLLSTGPDSGGPLGFCARGDLDALAGRIVELLADRAAIDRIGARAREYVVQTHSRERVAPQIEQCFQNLLRER